MSGGAGERQGPGPGAGTGAAALTGAGGLVAPLCAVHDIADGAARGFDPLRQGHDSMFVVRRGDRLFGWRNFCPHYGHDRMAWEKDGFLGADGARIVCGAHGAQYEIETGVCVAGPCVGKRLVAVPLEIRDGAVWVVGPYPRRVTATG